MPKVHLEVRETNRPIAEFYQRLGYDLMPRITMRKMAKALSRQS